MYALMNSTPVEKSWKINFEYFVQEKTNDTDAAQSDGAEVYHPVTIVANAKPEAPKSEEVEPTTEKKSRRHKYGVDDEQLSLGDARSKFGEPM